MPKIKNNKIISLILTLLISLFLSSCGRVGELYLEDEGKNQAVKEKSDQNSQNKQEIQESKKSNTKSYL